MSRFQIRITIEIIPYNNRENSCTLIGRKLWSARVQTRKMTSPVATRKANSYEIVATFFKKQKYKNTKQNPVSYETSSGTFKTKFPTHLSASSGKCDLTSRAATLARYLITNITDFPCNSSKKLVLFLLLLRKESDIIIRIKIIRSTCLSIKLLQHPYIVLLPMKVLFIFLSFSLLTDFGKAYQVWRNSLSEWSGQICTGKTFHLCGNASICLP